NHQALEALCLKLWCQLRQIGKPFILGGKPVPLIGARALDVPKVAAVLRLTAADVVFYDAASVQLTGGKPLELTADEAHGQGPLLQALQELLCLVLIARQKQGCVVAWITTRIARWQQWRRRGWAGSG